jgi:hypothetical protein
MSVRKKMLNVVLLSGWLFWLLNCGGPQHSVDERYFLVSSNIKLPYWQAAAAGLRGLSNSSRPASWSLRLIRS